MSLFPILRFLALALVIFGTRPALAQLSFGGPATFDFVAFGDMPYRIPEDDAKTNRLIAAINRLKPAFSIHIGDIKGGSVPCSDAVLQKAFDQLQRLEQPLVYTPGDNEWTDCHRPRAGNFDPRERLVKLRQIFYPKPGRSLGRATMEVQSQGLLDARFADYVENQRFEKNGVLFILVHVVGSNNGFESRDPAAATEYFARNAANETWIADGFRAAELSGAKAVVVAFQADLFDVTQKYPAMPTSSGFIDTVKAITKGARSFGKPVLVVHGDAHEFEVMGFRGTNLKLVPNVIRLQVMGAERVHGVRVLVDPDDPAVFAFHPLIVRENGPF